MSSDDQQKPPTSAPIDESTVASEASAPDGDAPSPTAAPEAPATPDPTVPEPVIQVAPPEGESPETTLSGKKVVLLVLAVIVGVFGGLVVLVLATSRPAHHIGYVVDSGSGELDASADADLANEAGEADAESDAEAAVVLPKQWRVADLKSDSSVEVLEVALGKRPVLAVLNQAGLAKGESARLLKAFRGLLSFDKCQPKDTLIIAKDQTTKTLRGFEYQTSLLDVWQARDESGELSAKKLEFHLDEKRIAFGTLVTSDLRTAIMAAGIDPDLLNILDDALDGHLELAEVKPGSRLRILATEQRVDGAFLRYSDVLAVEYVAPGAAKPPLRVYHFDGPSVSPKEKLTGYYDSRGHQPFHGGFRSPIPFARVTSRFNPHRKHPVLHVVMPHNGVDFAASTGTPVYASAGGTVMSAANSGPCGNMVQLIHPNGLVTAYCHLSRFAAGLRSGQKVETRQLIGYSGQSGRVTGPHLHFAVKRGDRFLDPLALKLDGVRVVRAQDRDRFLVLRAAFDKELDAIVLSDLPAQFAFDGGPPEADAGEGEDELFQPDPLHENP